MRERALSAAYRSRMPSRAGRGPGTICGDDGPCQRRARGRPRHGECNCWPARSVGRRVGKHRRSSDRRKHPTGITTVQAGTPGWVELHDYPSIIAQHADIENHGPRRRGLGRDGAGECQGGRVVGGALIERAVENDRAEYKRPCLRDKVDRLRNEESGGGIEARACGRELAMGAEELRGDPFGNEGFHKGGTRNRLDCTDGCLGDATSQKPRGGCRQEIIGRRTELEPELLLQDQAEGVILRSCGLTPAHDLRGGGVPQGTLRRDG